MVHDNPISFTALVLRYCIYAEFSPELQEEIDTVPALRESKRDLFELEMWADDEERQRCLIRYMRDKGTTYAEAEMKAPFYMDEYDDEEEDTCNDTPSDNGNVQSTTVSSQPQSHPSSLMTHTIDDGEVQETREEEEQPPVVVDLPEVVSTLCEEIVDYFRDQGVYEHWDVTIRKDSNTKGRTRILISLQA